ncbi:nose resistant to fluoxetine protein 6-like, partial [Oppia nitens]|uniref:nose resistant to fluoxetine protein 6-like n=1 Tax=Oppia nitens TaxID=1686743 RepID=UPI0023DAF1E8
YLSVDMQIFIISPILILLLASNDIKKQYMGIAVNITVIIASWIITAVITVRNGLTPTVLMTVYDLDYINKIYMQSYCRIGPYCVGILMAYFYIKYKGKLLIKMKLNIILWILSLTLNLSITFLTYPWLLGKSYRNIESVLYGTTHRTLWALSWSYMLFASTLGYGSVVNKVLSWPAFVPLSRLSFQAYLYHSVLISRFVNSARQPMYSSKINLVMMFFQYTVLTFVVSYVAYIMFEIPIANIEKIFRQKSVSKLLPISDNRRDSVTNVNKNNININIDVSNEEDLHHNNQYSNYGTNS